VPKTYRDLWPQLVSFENLWLAYLGARRGKRSRPDVAAYEFEAEIRLLRLQERLESGSYSPAGYRTFAVNEWKRRLISAAPFEDRIVHHAVCRVTEPIWERRFIGDSFACRKGKGTLAAVNRAQHFARRWRYVLRLDVRAFFQSVDHAILLDLLARHIRDPRVMELCASILSRGRALGDGESPGQLFPGDDLFALTRPRGLPIGNLTSQFWANVYLHPLDLYVKQEAGCRAYVRYCDDLLLFGDDKRILAKQREAVRVKLAMLRLAIHDAYGQVSPVAVGFPFLGWTIFPERRRLRRRNVVRFRRRYRARLQQVADGEIDLERLHCTVAGWVGFAKQGSTTGLRRAVLAQVVPRGPRA
jgi:RNA-directed DNA polymerase